MGITNFDAVEAPDGFTTGDNQPANITEPSGGATIDAEARAAIDAILAALRTHGVIASS